MARKMKINATVAQWSIVQAARVLFIFAILQGLNILLSGVERWSSDSFVHALAVPGAPPTWGWVLLFGGLLATYGGIFNHYRALVVGGYICSAWSFFFAYAFGRSALEDAHASSLGFLSYLTFGVLYLGIAIVFNSSREATSAADGHNPRGS